MLEDRALGSRQKKTTTDMRSKLSSEINIVHGLGVNNFTRMREQVSSNGRKMVESLGSKPAMDLDSRVPAISRDLF